MAKFTVSVSRIISNRAADMRRDRSRVERDGRMWSFESGGESIEDVNKCPWRGRVAAESDEIGIMQDVRKVGTDLLR